jgi:hypothetical protein
VKALGIIRKELRPVHGQAEEPSDKVLSFNRISEKVRSMINPLLPIYMSNSLPLLGITACCGIVLLRVACPRH